MKSYVGRIEVEDASGCRFDIHEFLCRRRFRRVRIYVLDTGEDARAVDEHTFVIAGTGETFVRVSDDLTTVRTHSIWQEAWANLSSAPLGLADQ